jgi:GNAT superfamily N-acetyltransferase
MREAGVTTGTKVAGAAIRPADSPADVALARALFLEYARWLKVDLCFQGFEQELATLPGAYAPPGGRLLIVGTPGQAFGCIALRPLDSGSGCGCGAAPKVAAHRMGEVKRLYVKPEHRGAGWGVRLALTLIEEARAIGYKELKLDTLDWMSAARTLYSGIGFRECAPYYANPLAGAVYMTLAL